MQSPLSKLLKMLKSSDLKIRDKPMKRELEMKKRKLERLKPRNSQREIKINSHRIRELLRLTLSNSKKI